MWAVLRWERNGGEKEWRRVLECFVHWHLMLPYQTGLLCAGVHLLVDFSGGLFFCGLLWTQQMLRVVRNRGYVRLARWCLPRIENVSNSRAVMDPLHRDVSSAS